MQVKSSDRSRVRGHLIGLVCSAATCLAVVIGGCGPSSSETPQELTPEAKKALAAAKGTDLSKYAKPKSKAGNRR